MSSDLRGEVYTAHELARATGVPVEHVRALIASGEIPSVNGFVAHRDAIAWGRRQPRPARSSRVTEPSFEIPQLATSALTPPALFDFHDGSARQPGVPAAVSAGVHLLAGLAAVLITTAGLGSASAARTEYRLAEPMRLVYLALPGPGGGGGGGGKRQLAPPPAAKREGKRSLSSPLPEREPPPPLKPPKADAPPPPLNAERVPPIVAPVVASASDQQTRAGVLEKSDSEADSRGSGTGGGVGSGQGTGIGEGDGPGIGPGSGGGTGGGPYRPGSGIEPPSLLREVKPQYTEDARRRNVTGEVVLEIVVKYDGTVGDARVLQGLGYGLDQRAIDAVRQWRFAPAKRLGRPVDVMVEVAVEFRLR